VVSVHSGSTQRRASPCAGLAHPRSGVGAVREPPLSKPSKSHDQGDGKPSPYSL